MGSRWSLAAVGLLLLAGCAGTTGAHELSAAPAPAPSPALATVPSGRAQVFVPGVPRPDPGTTSEVTLDELLAYADAGAPEIRVARAASRRGEAEIEAASPVFQDNPEVGVSIGSRKVAGAGFTESEAGVEQRFEIAGERGLRLATAERTREVALSELDETRWAVHVAVHAAFLDALLARERVTAAERVVAFAQELDRVAERRVEAGDDSPLTRLLAQAELAQARERLVEARRDERAARSRVAQAAGWPAGTLPALQGTLPAVRRARAPDALLRLAAEHNPAFRTRELALAEARARVRLEDREAWPEPTVGFDYAREGGEPGSPENVWLFTVGVPLPIWNRNQGGRARAEVERGVAEREREAQRTTWAARLERAAAGVDAAADRVGIYGADVLPAVERNLQLIRRAYELGEIDIQALSQTRERVLETQSRALEAQSDYFAARGELEELVGTELDGTALEETKP